MSPEPNSHDGPDSDDVEGHTRVGQLRVHLAGDKDRPIDFPAEPGHQQLCDAGQAFVLRAVAEDIDLSRHMTDAVQSLSICLAADTSIRTGKPHKLALIAIARKMLTTLNAMLRKNRNFVT